MKHRPGSTVAAIAAAALIGISGIAAAQTPPRHHGPQGHHGKGDFISAIAGLESELNLNTSQQAMWDNAVAAGKAARDNARSDRQKIRATLDAELAKAEPDLAAVAAASDGARNAGATAHRQVRDAWLALYGTFTPEQKTVVKNALKDKLARADAFRQKMREHHGG
ncbi:MAG TPA: periplasmic heavy metal sensor [Casimicrobiaceae bacterium]|nr:periplasmic heavy metal sensor [Casimicrobiaceae bacterium]